jgi:glycerol-3-phosphate cytidylyltransferase
MRLVLTYGTFDLLHYGHLNIFARARSYGDRLFVGLSTDKFNALKNKRAQQSYEERYSLVSMCRNVDFIFPENNWEQKAHDIERFGASVFVMGDDWKGKFDFLKSKCEVVYLPRTSGISSTLIRSNLVPLAKTGT